MTMPQLRKILASVALTLAAVGVSSCTSPQAIAAESCQSPSAEKPTEPYVRQMPYSPIRDAELEQSSREQLAALQSLASSCKSVRVVIKWSLFTGLILQGTEVPLTESEKAELLSLIGKIQPVKPDLCAFVTPAYALELEFTMADGSIKTTRFPSVAPLRCVSSDGYAFMCSMALPDADAERLEKLANHEWVQQRINQARKH